MALPRREVTCDLACRRPDPMPIRGGSQPSRNRRLVAHSASVVDLGVQSVEFGDRGVTVIDVKGEHSPQGLQLRIEHETVE